MKHNFGISTTYNIGPFTIESFINNVSDIDKAEIIADFIESHLPPDNAQINYWPARITYSIPRQSAK